MGVNFRKKLSVFYTKFYRKNSAFLILWTEYTLEFSSKCFHKKVAKAFEKNMCMDGKWILSICSIECCWFE